MDLLGIDQHGVAKKIFDLAKGSARGCARTIVGDGNARKSTYRAVASGAGRKAKN
jgi:hypothetical protein